MVWVLQDLLSRKYGYKIIDMSEGVQRILDEAYVFSSPGEVLNYVTQIQEACKAGSINFGKDRDTSSFGYTMFDPKTRRELCSENGWDSPDAVQAHVANLKTSILEGYKIVSPPPSKVVKLNN